MVAMDQLPPHSSGLSLHDQPAMGPPGSSRVGKAYEAGPPGQNKTVGSEPIRKDSVDDAYSLAGTTAPCSPIITPFSPKMLRHLDIKAAHNLPQECKPAGPQPNKPTNFEFRRIQETRTWPMSPSSLGCQTSPNRLDSVDSVNSFASSSTRTDSKTFSETMSIPESTDDNLSVASLDHSTSGTITPIAPKHLKLAEGANIKGYGNFGIARFFEEPLSADPVASEFDLDDQTSISRRVTSIVLQNVYNVDLDEIPSPYLAWDCTERYLEELLPAIRGRGALAEGTKQAPNTPPSKYSPSSYAPVDGQQGYRGNGTGLKRGQTDGNGDDNGDNGDNENGDDDGQGSAHSPGARTKRPKTEENMNLSCPFRKRNPIRFNVRDYHLCATRPYANMSSLKKHIQAQHGRERKFFSCPRCKMSFKSDLEVEIHLSGNVTCSPKTPDASDNPEDVVSDKAMRALTERRAETCVRDWRKLWMTLFPMDSEDDIPSQDFTPVVEMQEYGNKLKETLPRIRKLLRDQVTWMLQQCAGSSQTHSVVNQGIETTILELQNWLDETSVVCREHYSRAPRFGTPPTPTISEPRQGPSRRSSRGEQQQFDMALPSRQRRPAQQPQPLQPRLIMPANTPQTAPQPHPAATRGLSAQSPQTARASVSPTTPVYTHTPSFPSTNFAFGEPQPQYNMMGTQPHTSPVTPIQQPPMAMPPFQDFPNFGSGGGCSADNCYCPSGTPCQIRQLIEQGTARVGNWEADPYSGFTPRRYGD